MFSTEKTHIKRSIIGIVSLLALAFSSCTNYQEEDAPLGFSVNQEELSFSQNGESQSLIVSSGTKWDVTDLPSWINLRSINRSGLSRYEWTADFYTSSNEEYNRDGKIVFKSQNGSVEVSVSQEGKKGRFVAVESVTLSKTELTLTVGESVALTYGIVPSDASIKDVSWESESTAIATVTQSGQIDAISEGNAIITVKTKDGGKTASCTVTVKPVAVSSVTLDKETLSLKIGETYSLIATVLPESAANKKVSWSSSNKSVATVDETGKVTATGVGSAKITVTTEDGGKTASCSVSVSSIPVTGVSLNKASLSLTIGGTEQLIATVAPTNATNKNVTWSSSNSNVATVDSNGNVSAIKVGTAIITATTEEGGKKATCSVTVNPVSVTGVSLNQTSLTMAIGDTQTLAATVTPSNATDKSVTWSSSNTSVATVSSSGVVTAKTAGSATITVTTNDGGKRATCSVTVQAQTVAVTAITLSQTSATLTYGQTLTLSATVLPANASDKTIVWTSSNNSIASVSEGVVTAGSTSGTATITAKSQNYPAVSATCKVTVTAGTVSVTGVSLNKTSLTMTVGDTQTLTATVTPSNATDKSVTWSSSNTSIATVSSSGVVTAKAAGTSTITVTTNDGGKKATCSVTVSAASVAVTGVSLNKTSLSMTVGDTQTLTATITPSNATDKSVTWSSSNTSVATVSTSGVVTAKAAGSATITVTTNDGGKKATCAVTIQAQTVSVTGVSLNKTSLSMTVGDTQTLTATITPSNATDKSVTWSSSNTSVATVSTSGVVTAKAAGSATITVTTNDGGKKATCTVSVQSFSLPVLSVVTVSNIQQTSATLSSGITSTGDGYILEKGFCYRDSPSPSIDDNIIYVNANNWTVSMTGLKQNTKYYVRSFATTQYGTSYSEEVSFTTSYNPVEFSPMSIIDIGLTDITVSCSVSSYGGNNVIDEGFCYSTSTNPTTLNSKVGSLGSTATATLSPLNKGTTYYIRRYVVNSVGTFYSEQLTVSTLSVPSDAIQGVFSVSNSKKVAFSKGSLLLAEDESLSFASSQYYCIGNDNVAPGTSYWGSYYNGVRNYPTDMLTTKLVQASKPTYKSLGDEWSVLTCDEWRYLLSSRENAEQLFANNVSVNGVSGVIILPDNWIKESNSPIQSNSSLSNSSFVNLENKGAVFIPYAGWMSFGMTYSHADYRMNSVNTATRVITYSAGQSTDYGSCVVFSNEGTDVEYMEDVYVRTSSLWGIVRLITVVLE